MRWLILFLASNAGLGYAPVASGTFGTLAGIPAFYLLSHCSGGVFLAVWSVLLLLSFWVAGEAGRIYGVVDDGRIVIDELVGYLATVAFLPFSWPVALLGFLLFRLFDILKPPPVSWFDRKMKNGYGVVLDDVAAGLYAAAVLRLLLFLSQTVTGV
ncbi:MAG: phosphatidylglycerophosphatase A [Desulfuromonadaceae bacterium]